MQPKHMLTVNDLFMGDPYLYFHENIYYLTGTADTDLGFKVYRSTNLDEWEDLGFAYRKNENSFGIRHYWAPEVFFHQGFFYMTYSALDSSTRLLLMGLAVSSRPEGPFTDLHSPWFDLGYSAIDGHIFRDDDHRLYLYFSRNWTDRDTLIDHGVTYGVELLPDLSGLKSVPKLLLEASQPWEKVLPDNRCNEGPTVWKHNGHYYMTYSANHTAHDCYGIGYAVCSSPLGEWMKSEKNPLLTTTPAAGIVSPGHNSILKAPDGTLLMTYHAKISGDSEPLVRTVRMDRLCYDEAGGLVIDKV